MRMSIQSSCKEAEVGEQSSETLANIALALQGNHNCDGKQMHWPCHGRQAREGRYTVACLARQLRVQVERPACAKQTQTVDFRAG